MTNIYEKIGDYYLLDGKNDHIASTEYFQQVESIYKTEVYWLKRRKADTYMINNVEKKEQ